MWTRLTFCSLRGRCGEVTVGFAPRPYLDTLSQMLLCDLSCQSLFLGRPLTPFCLEGLISPPFSLSNLQILSLKPICVVQLELSLLSPAPPLNKTATICPLNVFHLSYCPFSDTKNKQKLKLFQRLLLEYCSYCPCLLYLIPPVLTHLQPTSYTCTELTKVVWIPRNRTKHPLLWCTDALLTPVCPLKTAASSPSGAAPHIHNTLLCARWLSLQVLFPINQTVFELINNKSISRRLEMRVSRGRCLFVRRTSAALFLSDMELGLSLTLETWVAGSHKSKYQL